MLPFDDDVPEPAKPGLLTTIITLLLLLALLSTQFWPLLTGRTRRPPPPTPTPAFRFEARAARIF
jgi:UPF0716 family protein affecting phage T7 exclusion